MNQTVIYPFQQGIFYHIKCWGFGSAHKNETIPVAHYYYTRLFFKEFLQHYPFPGKGTFATKKSTFPT
jgi:hypothetical protein